MADGMLPARSALAAVTLPVATAGEPGVTLSERPAGAQILLLARRGQAEALAARLAPQGLMLGLRPGWTSRGAVTILATGPGQWLVLGPAQEGEGLMRSFGAFTALCSAVRADDARTLIGVTGPRAADALAKMLPVDLHPRAFGEDGAAATVAGGIPVLVWRLPAGGFGCGVPRSFARSFWDWLGSSAAEFGVAGGGAET